MRVRTYYLPGLSEVPVESRPTARGDVILEHAALSAALLERVFEGLRRARERTLVRRPANDIIDVLGRVAAAWLDPASEWYRRALEALPAVTGFSEAMIDGALARIFAPYGAENLRALVRAEIGGAEALDGFIPTPWGESHAAGPDLLLHITAGNVPGLALPVLFPALVTKAAVMIKSASGEPVLPALIARSIASLDADLGACVAVAQWPGGEAALDAVALDAAGVVVVEGDDATVTAVSARARGRVLGFGHRASFALVTREATADAPRVVADLARDISLYDQHGCLSPQVVYVETGGAVGPAALAESLAEALIAMERELPRRTLAAEEHAAVRRLRDAAEWRGIRGEDVRIFGPGGPSGPTVIYETDPLFEPTPANRTVRLKPIARAESVANHLGSWRSRLECVGIAGLPERVRVIAGLLAGATTVSRVCPIGRMQSPTLGWHHSGLSRLGSLLRWIDVEHSEPTRPRQKSCRPPRECGAAAPLEERRR